MDGALDDREFFEDKTVGVFARGKWYRSLTLRHQIEADTEVTHTNFVGEHEIGMDEDGQWLWVLADRVRLDTQVGAALRYRETSLGGRGCQNDSQ